MFLALALDPVAARAFGTVATELVLLAGPAMRGQPCRQPHRCHIPLGTPLLDCCPDEQMAIPSAPSLYFGNGTLTDRSATSRLRPGTRLLVHYRQKKAS